MRGSAFLLGVLLVIVLWIGSTVEAFGQYASVKWQRIDDTQAALVLDGVQAGNVRFSDGTYFPREGDGFGKPCDCPVDIPADYRPKTDWRTNGVNTARIAAPKPASADNTPADAGATPTIPEFHKMPSITVVSADKKHREAIAKAFASDPALAPWKDHRVKVYAPTDPLLAPFKLADDKSFAASGTVLLVQPAPDASNHAPVTSIYGFTSAEDTASKLREINADYDPNDTAYSPWTRTHVALGVGLGVAAVCFLGIGGSMRWARS